MWLDLFQSYFYWVNKTGWLKKNLLEVWHLTDKTVLLSYKYKHIPNYDIII